MCVCTCLQTELIDSSPRSSDFIGCAWKLALFGYAGGKYKQNLLDQWLWGCVEVMIMHI